MEKKYSYFHVIYENNKFESLKKFSHFDIKTGQDKNSI